MNRQLLLSGATFFLFFLNGCKSEYKPKSNDAEIRKQMHHDKSSWNAILDSFELEGAILIYNAAQDMYFSNDLEYCKVGRLPASTFKIPNTIVGLETGVIDSSKIFKWKGEKREMEMWEKDLPLAQAFSRSCVPCYQEMAREIGVERMRGTLSKLEFGTMTFDKNDIDLFWLVGDSKISQFEQIHFLDWIYNEEYDLNPSTYRTIKKIMLRENTPTYSLYGKTGWAKSKDQNHGWFVGYVVNESGNFYFATNVSLKPEKDINDFPKSRIDVTRIALKDLNIIP